MVEYVRVLADDPALYSWLSRGAVSTVLGRFSKQSVFTKFSWALVQAYPELSALFARDDSQEGTCEDFNRGACLSIFDQSRKVDSL